MTASVTVLNITQRQRHWSFPSYPAGLYEDAVRFHFDGDEIDRGTFDRCIRAVGETGPTLLSDLVDDGTIDLEQLAFAGAVASVWAATRHAPSALTTARWVELFRANGFSVDGRRADRPAAPVRVFRGCVPMIRLFDAAMCLVDVDGCGRPLDPAAVVEIRDTRIDLAWTSSLRSARAHARNCIPGHVGQVFAAAVQPEHLLAVIGGEYVIDPAGLSLDTLEPVSIEGAAVRR